MSTRVGINGFGRIGRQSLKALIERSPRGRGRRRQRPRRHELNALLFKHDSTYGAYRGHSRPHRRRADHRRSRDQGPQGARSGEPALGRPRRRHRPRVDRPVHRRRQGRRPTSTPGRTKVIISAPGQGRGHHDRPGRERGSLRPRQPPHHQQRQLHHQLPGPRGQGRPRPGHHRARPDEHDPLYTNDQRILDVAHKDPRRARAPARTSSRRRPARAKALALVIPDLEGQVRRLQPARADARPSASSTSPRTSAGRPRSRS